MSTVSLIVAYHRPYDAVVLAFPLALAIARHPETLPLVLEDFRPNLLANSLYHLANCFHAFYEACPVLQASPAVRPSRLALCSLTARVIRHGLGLLGISCPERM